MKHFQDIKNQIGTTVGINAVLGMHAEKVLDTYEKILNIQKQEREKRGTAAVCFDEKFEFSGIDDNNFCLFKYSKSDTVYRIPCN